jgi:hypothetical protein
MHSFDPKIAEIVGLAPAVIYQNIVWWIAKNEANEQNKYDGYFWTYNSVKAFSVLFPYLTEKQVRTSLDKLVEVGLIVAGNYNTSAYDRTKWFRLGGQIDLPCGANGIVCEGEPIPDIKPPIKPDRLDTNVSLANKRGTRISENWQPSQDDFNQALQMGLTVEQVDNEANKFRDYWIGVPGAKGVKLNWSATWRNRCRDVVEWGSKQTRGSNTYRNGSESTSLSGEAVRVAKEFAGHRNDRRA